METGLIRGRNKRWPEERERERERERQKDLCKDKDRYICIERERERKKRSTAYKQVREVGHIYIYIQAFPRKQGSTPRMLSRHTRAAGA